MLEGSLKGCSVVSGAALSIDFSEEILGFLDPASIPVFIDSVGPLVCSLRSPIVTNAEFTLLTASISFSFPLKSSVFSLNSITVLDSFFWQTICIDLLGLWQMHLQWQRLSEFSICASLT